MAFYGVTLGSAFLINGNFTLIKRSTFNRYFYLGSDQFRLPRRGCWTCRQVSSGLHPCSRQWASFGWDFRVGSKHRLNRSRGIAHTQRFHLLHRC